MPLSLQAQVYNVSDESKVTIEGISTMHDWESIVEKVSGKGTFTIEEGHIREIQDMEVTFVVKSIESGKSLMNKLTYEALKEEQHPNITFRLTKVTSISDKKN